MGYYSEVGLAMPKKDYERLLAETLQLRNQHDAYECLTEYCNNYSYVNYHYNEYDPILNRYKPNKNIPIIILHWFDIKISSKGMNYILDFVETHGGIISIVGEEIGDVEQEVYYGPNNEYEDIEWNEFVEAYSMIEIKQADISRNNFYDFMREIK